MKRKKSFYTVLCISVILFISGCQNAPDTVKKNAKKYQKTKSVEETDITYTSIDHILDNQEEILEKAYQNLEFKKTVHLEQPDSISVLSMTIANPFTSKEKFADLCSIFFDTDKYSQEIVRMDDFPALPGEGVYAFNYESDNEDNATVSDSGFFACQKKDAQVFTNRQKAVCHVDWNEDMNAVYNIGGENVSIREAVDYVNDWCNTNWSIMESEYTYQVKTVYVCKAADDKNFYYYFDVCKFYKGVPFDDIDFYIDEDNVYIRNSLDVVMEQKNALSFFRNNNNSYNIAKEETYNDKLISLEQAVLLVQKKMSGGQKFEIADIDLKYIIRSDLTYEDLIKEEIPSYVTPGCPVTARPVWSFILNYQPTKEEEANVPWPRKFINVDMITGDILYRDIIQ